jgi:23S rRNA G2445 N2-methylase RlmL
LQPIFVLTTRGLEHVSAGEIGAIPEMQVTAVGYRRVAALATGELRPLLGLRTVDDVFVDLGSWEGIGHRRAVLHVMGDMATGLDLEAGVAAIRQVRKVPAPPVFSVTASFVGRRNYSSGEIRGAVGAALAEHTGWRLSPEDRGADVNLRLFIEHERAHVGLRLASRPLHRRAYKLAHLPGSLKPPVAAAMVRLARVCEGDRVLDPCCGAGTILIEASMHGASALGGDIGAEAVGTACANSVAAGVSLDVAVWDARRLPLADGCAMCSVTNLPWGGEVDVVGQLPELYQSIGAEIARVTQIGGRIAVLTDAPQHVRLERLQVVERHEISLYGRTPTVTVLRAT